MFDYHETSTVPKNCKKTIIDPINANLLAQTYTSAQFGAQTYTSVEHGKAFYTIKKESESLSVVVFEFLAKNYPIKHMGGSYVFWVMVTCRGLTMATNDVFF